jgi:hypothetical protein
MNCNIAILQPKSFRPSCRKHLYICW